MDSTIQGLRNLSTTAKQILLDAIVIYPNTESIRADIVRAEELGVMIPFASLEDELDKIVIRISKDPRFNQLSSRDLNVEVLKSMTLKPDLNYNSVDYIYFQRINTPTLCLRNTNSEAGARGVSIFIDLNDARVQLHRTVSFPDQTYDLLRNLEKSLPIAIAIVIAGFLIGRSMQK